MTYTLISGVSHKMSHRLSHELRLSERGSLLWLRVKTSATSPRIEVSLRTRDRVEAQRRAARVAVALPLGPTPATVRTWIEAMDRIGAANMPARAKLQAEIELDATARRQALDPLDDPAFRDALCAEAEARGWYGPPDADETIEHFRAMRAGMDAMTKAYHDACKRKGIDAATRRRGDARAGRTGGGGVQGPGEPLAPRGSEPQRDTPRPKPAGRPVGTSRGLTDPVRDLGQTRQPPAEGQGFRAVDLSERRSRPEVETGFHKGPRVRRRLRAGHLPHPPEVHWACLEWSTVVSGDGGYERPQH